MCVFISYSRKEFYFAEALARDLRARGIAVWFDVFDISPGGEWDAQIVAGVAASNFFLLIASRSSLISPYVEREWREALGSGRTIAVVAFEAVDLPAELADFTAFDFRSSYEAKVDALVAYLHGEKSKTDQAPKPNLLGLPTALPPAVLLTAGALFLTASIMALWLVWFFVELGLKWSPSPIEGFLAKVMYQHPTWLAVEAAMILGVVFLGRKCLRFIRRSADPDIRANLFFMAPLLLWAMANTLGGMLDYWAHVGSDRSILETGFRLRPWQLNDEFVGMLFWATLAVWALDWAVCFMMRNSIPLLRWSPVSPVWERLRVARLGQRAAPEATETGPRVSRCIEVLAGPDDSSVSRAIERAMLTAGHQLAAPAGPASEISLVVLSDQTSAAWLDEVLAIAAGRSIVVIAATSVDVGNNRPLITQLQWVDFRKRLPATLHQLARALGRSGEGSRPAEVRPAPEALNWPVYPVRVTQAWVIFSLVVGWAIGTAVAVSLYADQFVPPIATGWVVALATVVSLLGLWLWRSLLTRSASRRAFLTVGAIMVLGSAWLLVLLNPALSMHLKAIEMTGLEGAQALVFLGAILVLPFSLAYSHAWLPAEPKSFESRRYATLAPKHHRVFTPAGMVYVGVGVFMGALIVLQAARIASILQH